MDLTGKRVVLTGAASGIGRALLEALSRMPLEVVAADVNETRLLEVCAGLRDVRARVIPVTADVSSAAGNDALISAAVRAMKGVDVYIANAGFAVYEHALMPDWARFEGLFRVNTLAPIHALQQMTALNAGRAFKVVWVASAMAHMGLPRYAAYSASKGALHRYADAHRYSMPDPNALMLVYPIATRTRFFEGSSAATPVPKPNQSAEEVTRAILRGIATDAREVYPSLLFRVTLWVSLWFPGLRRFVQLRELRD
ncbi:MAG: SDR family NAD(P)-dependent oxidoreductase [Pleurocapsa sp. SU_196_0]|nr:SDR family NAD(P)-dependent oxidoreductase [Pleurocapsa sp. SU_196_0]